MSTRTTQAASQVGLLPHASSYPAYPLTEEWMKKNLLGYTYKIYNRDYNAETISKQCNGGDPLGTPGGFYQGPPSMLMLIATTNLAVCQCVCVCAKFDQFLPARSHFDSKRPENLVRIATFPSATFGLLFAFHCPLFFTKNNNLEWKSSSFATRDVFDLNAGVLPQMSPPLYGGGDINR